MLRDELTKAIGAAVDEDLVFALRDIEMQFQVGITHGGTAEAGIKPWVFTLDAQISDELATVRTIKLTLTPGHAPYPTRTSASATATGWSDRSAGSTRVSARLPPSSTPTVWRRRGRAWR